MSFQWKRKASLVVLPDNGTPGIDLSQLQFRFTTRQNDVQSPNNCEIRVYNLSKDTMNKLTDPHGAGGGEFTRVILQAGYDGDPSGTGNYGTIFDGQIRQFRRGRENATDKYLDILAADGDLGYNFGVVNKTLAAGSTAEDRVNAAFDAMQAADPNLSVGNISGLSTQKLPRGRPMFGMARNVLRTVGRTNQASWDIHGGKLQILPYAAVLPEAPVVVNSKTGMIGQPEQTIDGIHIKTLLNPFFKIGGRVKIDNQSINSITSNDGDLLHPFDSYTGYQKFATEDYDGNYKIIVAEHMGDTRGQDWYTNLICIALDDTLPLDQAAKGRV